MLSSSVYAIAVGLLTSRWTYTSSCMPLGPHLQVPVAKLDPVSGIGSLPSTISASSSTDATHRHLVFSAVDSGTSFHPNQISTFAREELALIDAQIRKHGASGRIPSQSWPANAYDVTMTIIPDTNLPASQADWTHGMLQFVYHDLVRQNTEAEQRHTSSVESSFKVYAANDVVVATGSLLRSTLGAVSNPTIIARSSSAADPAAVSKFDFSVLPISSGAFLDQSRTVASLQGFLAKVDVEISTHCPTCPIPRDAWILNDDFLELESYANAVYPPMPEDWTWQTLQYIVVKWLEWASRTAVQPQTLQESYFFVDKTVESTRAVHVVSGSLKRYHPGTPPAPPDAAAAIVISTGSEANATSDPTSITSRSLETVKRATVASNTTALTALNVSDLNLGLYLDRIQAARNIPQSSIISLVEIILRDIGRAADASQPLPNLSYSQKSGPVKLTLESQGLEAPYWTYGLLEWFGGQLLKQGGRIDSLFESSVRILDISGEVYPYPGKLVVAGSLALTSTIVTNATTSVAMETANNLDLSVLLTPIRNGLRIPRSPLLGLIEEILNDVERSPGGPQPLPGTSYRAKSELLELDLVKPTTRGEGWTYGMLESMCGALLEQEQKMGLLYESKVDIVTSVLVATGSLKMTSHQSAGGRSSPANDQSGATALQLASEKRTTPVITNTTALIALNVSVPNLRLTLTDRNHPEIIPRLAFRFLARQIFEELADITDLAMPLPGNTWQDDTEYIYLSLEKASQGAEESWTYEMLEFIVENLLAMSEVGPRLRESNLKVLNMDGGSPGRTVASGTLLLYPRLQGISHPGNDQDATARVDVTSRSMETVKRSLSSDDPGGTGADPISDSAHDYHQSVTASPHPTSLTMGERATLPNNMTLTNNITLPHGLNLRGELTPIREPFSIPRLAFQALIGQIVDDIETCPDWQSLSGTLWRDHTVLMSLSLSRVEGGVDEDWTYGMLRWVLVWLIRREIAIGLRESRLKVFDMDAGYPGRLVATGALFLASSRISRPGKESSAMARNHVSARSLPATAKRTTYAADTTAAIALNDPFVNFRLELDFLPERVSIPRLALHYLVTYISHDTRHTTNPSQPLPSTIYHADTGLLILRLYRVEAGEAEWTYGFLDWLCEAMLQQDEQQGPLPVGSLVVRDTAGGGRGRFIASGVLLLSVGAVEGGAPQNDTAKVDIASRSLETTKMTNPNDTTAMAALNEPKFDFYLDLEVSHGGLFILRDSLHSLMTLILNDIQPYPATQSIPQDSYRFNSGDVSFTLRRDADGAGSWTYGLLRWVSKDLLEKNEEHGPLRTCNIEVLTVEGKPVADGVLLLSRYEGGGVSVPDSDQNATTGVDVTSRSLDTTNISALALASPSTRNIQREFRLSPLHAALTIPQPVLVSLVMKMLDFIERGPGPDASLPEASYSVTYQNLDFFLRRVGTGGGDWTYGMLMYVSLELLASVSATVKESTVQVFQVLEGRPSSTAAGVMLLSNRRGAGVGGQVAPSSAIELDSTTAASADALPVTAALKKRATTLSLTNASALAATNATITSDLSNYPRSIILTRLSSAQIVPHSALVALAQQIVRFIEHAPDPDAPLPRNSYVTDTNLLLGLNLMPQAPMGIGQDWTYGLLAYVCGELLLASVSLDGLQESLFMVYDGVGPGAVFVAFGMLEFSSRAQHANATVAALTISNTSTTTAPSTAQNASRSAAVAAALPPASSTINRNLILTPLRDPLAIPHPDLLDLILMIIDFIGTNASDASLPELSYNWATERIEFILFRQAPAARAGDWTYGMLAYLCSQFYWVTMSRQGAWESLVQVFDVVGQARPNLLVGAGALMVNGANVAAGNTTNTTFMDSSSSYGDNLTTTALAAAGAALPPTTSTIRRNFVFNPLRNPVAIPGQDLRDLDDEIFDFIGPNFVEVPLPNPSYTWKTDQVQLLLFREGPSAAGSDDWTYGMLTFLCFKLYSRSLAPEGVPESYVQVYDVVGDGRPDVLVAFGVLATTNPGNASVIAAAAANTTNTTTTTTTTLMTSNSNSKSSYNTTTTTTTTAQAPAAPPQYPSPYLFILRPLPPSPLLIPRPSLLALIQKLLDDIERAGGDPDTPLPDPHTYSATAELVELTLSPLHEGGDWNLGMLTFVSARLLETMTGLGRRESVVWVFKDEGPGGEGVKVWERVVEGRLEMRARDGKGVAVT